VTADVAACDGPQPPLLRLTAVEKAFAGVRALRGVSFDLRAGECHALVGENGAGKSTLIKVITGAHAPDAGTLEIGGRVVTANDPVRARGLGVAAIYQQPALFPDLSVAENLAIGTEPGGPWRRVRGRDRAARAKRLLAEVGARVDPGAAVRGLSMADQQLVEVARAVGAGARIVVMDEPTAALSGVDSANLFRVVRGLKARGVGVIYISHRLEELPEVADRVTALRDGLAVATRPMAAVGRGELIRLMVGRELSAVFPKVAVPIGPAVLVVSGLGCRASGVSGVSLTVRAGEIVGLSGLVGAGRTELARVLFGVTPADRGLILLNGWPVVVDSPGRAVDLGIAYVPEDRRRHGLIAELPVAANLTLATLRAVSRFGLIDRRAERSLAEESVRRLGVKTASVAEPAGNLSGGNQQKVALGRWLAAGPTVLILDEPTQGVDVGAKAEIHRLMGELAGRGMAILMISSELPEILGMSDRVVVMRGGAVVGEVGRDRATPELLLNLALGQAQSPADLGAA